MHEALSSITSATKKKKRMAKGILLDKKVEASD
jgi:hypothetical protein